VAGTGTGRPQYAHLDAIRGLAALAVLAGHVRLLFLVPYGNLSRPGAFWRVFYFLTGFGHEAVIIFFVLSGLLVSASVFRDGDRGGWSWRDYLIRRCSRLYVVLIPGLLLTVLWDRCGAQLFPDHLIYAGHTETESVLNYAPRDSLGPLTLLGNLLFLQTIFVLPFGTNGPLWSLSNEFWYYMLFPCLWLVLSRGQALPSRLGHGLAAVLLGALVGWEILAYFPIWLMGAALGLRARGRAGDPGRGSAAACAALGAVFLAVAALARLRSVGPQALSDYLLAAAFSAWLWCLLGRTGRWTEGWYASAAGALAGCSYSVYVAHFPVLVFLHACLITEGRWAPTAPGLALWAGIFLGVVVYAYLLSRLTEAHTGAVRRWAAALLAGGRGRWLPGSVPVPTERGADEAASL
jgi:peptidoglycan/LPS O-acetylase OafA/YrhL